MNLSQKQNVCNAIQDFNTVENNFENIAAEKYKNETQKWKKLSNFHSNPKSAR